MRNTRCAKRFVGSVTRSALRVGLCVTLTAGAALVASPGYADDTTPPQLTALSFPSATVDVSGGLAQLTAQYGADDDLSGITSFQLLWMPPGQGCGVGTSEGFAPTLNRTGAVSIPLGQFSTPIGVWSVCQVYVADAAGNARYYSSADLVMLGLPTEVMVSGTQDTTAPQLTALSITPTTVDVLTGGATVNIDYAVTDDLSGAVYFTVAFTPPGGGCWPGGTDDFTAALTHSGTVALQLGQFSTPIGTWSVCQLYIYDAVGNRRLYSAADLAALGLPTSFAVTGTQDITATPSSSPTRTDTPLVSPTATATSSPLPTASATPTATQPATCHGDCDGNGEVTVDDLLRMVNIGLGSALVSECQAGDADQDGAITVDEILLAVNNALNLCPS